MGWQIAVGTMVGYRNPADLVFLRKIIPTVASTHGHEYSEKSMLVSALSSGAISRTQVPKGPSETWNIA